MGHALQIFTIDIYEIKVKWKSALGLKIGGKKILFPEGWKDGLQLALPKSVSCFKSLQSALQM